MFSSNTSQVDGGYQISRSLRFNSADTAYLARTPSTASNRRTYTWSGWVKRSVLGSDQRLFEAGASSSNVFWFGFGYGSASDQFQIQDYSGGFAIILNSTPIYRDPSAWYHVVVAIDTTQATSTDRVKLYINGVQITFTGTPTYPSQNYDTRTNQTVVHDLGGSTVIGGSAYFNGYITEVNFIDGSQLTPSSFGETNAQTGVWQPKAYSGSYGTNGFYLNFSDNSNTTAATLGKDYSGNGNNWTPNNFSVTAGAGNDSYVDSPTSYGTDTGVGGTVRGNYATLNPLALKGSATLSNGNLDAYSVYSGDVSYATIAMSSGKWYWEATPISGGGAYMIGISKDVTPLTDWQSANGLAYYSVNGNKYTSGSGSSYGATFTTNDVIGVALDMDAGTLVFYKNGTSQGTAFSGITGTWFASHQNPGANNTVTFNFGQRPFAYTAPSGFKALCTQNLPTPTIGATTATQAGKYYNAVTYTGNGSARSITGLGFQPDFTWIKARSITYSPRLSDSVRGVGKELYSDDIVAEVINSSNGYVTSFDSDGFSLGTGVGVNGNTTTFVAWNWKANGSGSTNTSGSITSTVSANTTAGFSVVTYTGNGTNGATIGHGLGVTPSMVILKSRSGSTYDWRVYHSGLTAGYNIAFNSSSAQYQGSAGNAGYIGAVASTTFTLNQSGANVLDAVNASGSTYVAYCFSEIAGYSKFGTYTGNGSSDGVFVYTGFRPAYVLNKSTSAGNGWNIHDDTRSPNNVASQTLFVNASTAEAGIEIDILSNGFKMRDTSANVNGNGVTYIFAAFAETPLKYALAR